MGTRVKPSVDEREHFRIRHTLRRRVRLLWLAMADFIRIADKGDVRTLTMSNPTAKNAVPADGWAALREAFDMFESSDQRVLIVTGADGEFCAGADMHREVVSVPSAADNASRMRRTNAAAISLHRLSKPTIAAVDGVAVGAGMNLALGCDIVVATERSRFSEIFVRRGLTLDFGGTWLLPRLVGLARARELALTGRVFSAEEALGMGMISEVVPASEFEGRLDELAVSLARGAPLAQAVIKRALDRSSSMTFEQALSFEEQSQAVLLGSDDLTEGAAAFIEKRDAEFKGR